MKYPVLDILEFVEVDKALIHVTKLYTVADGVYILAEQNNGMWTASVKDDPTKQETGKEIEEAIEKLLHQRKQD